MIIKNHVKDIKTEGVLSKAKYQGDMPYRLQAEGLPNEIDFPGRQELTDIFGNQEKVFVDLEAEVVPV